MNIAALLRLAPGTQCRAALIGAGQFGRSFVFQAERNAYLRVCAVVDREPARAVAVLRAAGVPTERIAICDGPRDAAHALQSGKRVVLSDASPLAQLPLDIVVEATGNPEIGAANAAAALDAGMHVAMVSKEADCTVGPALARRAHARGLVYTPVDGDQPSLLIGLVEWARLVGLDIVAAGKSCEYDFVYDASLDVVHSNGTSVDAPKLRACWPLSEAVEGTIAARSAAVHGLARQTVPDLAELALVANATGIKPDVGPLHAPLLRTLEVPSVLRPVDDGGILRRRPALDVFCCLRAPGEVSFAGGVFVVVRCDDEASWEVLAGKGIPVARNGRHAMLYNPQHLLGIEAIVSVLAAGAARIPSGVSAPQPVCDVTARALQPLRAGTPLALGERHALPGVEPLLVDAAPAHGSSPLPYYLAASSTLVRDVQAGAVVTCDDVAPIVSSMTWALRREQDAAFFPQVVA